MLELRGTVLMNYSNDHVFELTVNKGEPALVPPAKETEKGLYFLSNLDQNIAIIVQTVYCYKASDKGSEAAAGVMKDALAKVLVHYYPLAGRLTISSEGKLIVNCTSEGAVFVKAHANCTMDAVGNITKPDPATLGKLLYDIPGAKNMLDIPPLVAQVCEFDHLLLLGLESFDRIREFLLLWPVDGLGSGQIQDVVGPGSNKDRVCRIWVFFYLLQAGPTSKCTSLLDSAHWA